MNARERRIRQRLKDEFEHYAPRCLWIRAKSGDIHAFALNASQRHVHERIEAQRSRTGKVRTLILKARQWGCSTYVEGRYYWRVTHRRGVKTFILTHHQDATDNIFGMASRYHENCPELVRPHTGASNAKELYFDALDSGYKVATAGSKAVGRSDTIQFFHGSEVAYWPNAEDHVAGVLQAVPDLEGTEVILESTANGPDGVFHDMCQEALNGESEYELIFVPWFWHEEYATEPPEEWSAPRHWAQYRDTHDLTRAQLYWAYCKNRELAKASASGYGEPCWLFRQEYPATPEEAFQVPRREGRIYKNFGDDNVRRDVEDLGGTILVGMDFNVDPMTAVLGSKAGDELHVWDEAVINNGNTEEMVAEIARRYPGRDICVYPDPSGQARKTSAPAGQTDFTIIRDAGMRLRAPSKAPPVVDRINEVNALACDGDERRKLLVHPRCKTLITALNGHAYKEGTSQPDKTMGLDHPTDALGYLVHYEFPISGGRVSARKLKGF